MNQQKHKKQHLEKKFEERRMIHKQFRVQGATAEVYIYIHFEETNTHCTYTNMYSNIYKPQMHHNKCVSEITAEIYSKYYYNINNTE